MCHPNTHGHNCAKLNMPSGKCIWFNNKLGYGFIQHDDSEKAVFVHQSNIQMQGFRKLKDNQKVMFDVDANNGKPKAVNVQPINNHPIQVHLTT